MSKISKDKLRKAEQILVDNGIEKGAASTVLQALGYALLDEELYDEVSKDTGKILDSVKVFRNALVGQILEMIEKNGGIIEFPAGKTVLLKMDGVLNDAEVLGEVTPKYITRNGNGRVFFGYTIPAWSESTEHYVRYEDPAEDVEDMIETLSVDEIVNILQELL